MDEDEKRDAYTGFDEVVNMSPAELEEWLAAAESREVGMTREGEHEAVGHQSGRRIVELKRARKADRPDGRRLHPHAQGGRLRAP